MNKEAKGGAAASCYPDFLSGGGEMGALMRTRDWSDSPVGAPDSWPQSLKAAVGLVLPAQAQIVLFWGPEFVAIYNDAYAPTIGEKHPRALGRPARENWAELWGDLEPLLRRVRDTGETVFAKDRPFHIERHGYPETAYFDISYSAVPGENGAVGGILCIVSDTTERVRAEHQLRQSEERLRIATEAAAIGTWDFDPMTGVLSWDSRCKQLFGLPPSAKIDYETFLAGLHPEDREPTHAAVQHALDPKGPGAYDVEYRTIGLEDGVERWIAATGRAFFEGDGKARRAVRFIGTVIDISERRRTEAAVRESEKRFRALVNATSDVVYRMSADWTEMRQLDGRGFIVDTDQPRIRWLEEYIFPEDHDHVMAVINEAIRTKSTFQLEHRVRRVDGSVGWTFSRAIPVLDDRGQIVEWFGLASDITARKSAEEATRANEARFRDVFQNAGVGMIEIDADWNILTSNQAYHEITGRIEDDLQGANCLSFTHPDDVAAGEGALRALSAGQTGRVSFEKRYVRPNGEVVWVRSTLSRVSGEKSPNRFLKIVEDITEIRRAREALREETQNLEILNSTGTAVAAELDLDKVVQMVTDAGVELTGAQFGAFFYNVIDDAGESYMLYALSGADPSEFNFGMPRNTEVFHPTFSGEGTLRSDDITKDPRYGKNPPHNGMPKGHLPVRSYLAVPVVSRSGEVLGGLFFGHPETARFTERHERLLAGIAGQAAIAIDNARLYQDVQRANETLEQRVQERTAELETANEALRQAQKMEAIGQLTGGIAHDFNNMLTVIRGSADFLQRAELGHSKRERYVQAIAETADRAARLTAQLLAFARRQALKPEIFDVNERVHAVGEMLRTVLGSRINLQIEDNCEDCFVETDAAQFEAALVNMAVNGRDAMNGEGELRIETGRSERLPTGGDSIPDEGFVTVSVTDEGHGIDPENLHRIFEPFFTTKETGKGTGLGLSQVYGFAKQSGGEIQVRSEVGRGTSFTIYLPRVSGPEQRDDRTSSAISAAAAEGRVLVVEDNEEVGQFAEQVLADLGFSAQRANSAAEALALLDGGERFDVVFSDIVMPGQNGIDLAHEIRGRWPNLPVVLTTGYSDVLALRSDHSFPVLHKPYSLEALGAALGKALQR